MVRVVAPLILVGVVAEGIRCVGVAGLAEAPANPMLKPPLPLVEDDCCRCQLLAKDPVPLAVFLSCDSLVPVIFCTPNDSSV